MDLLFTSIGIFIIISKELYTSQVIAAHQDTMKTDQKPLDR